ncbi:unnamed protein product [Effrenium voratum]|uniref:Nudix hydrolase domain-containing protein n=1 Tax=Effrenium voratum TaxID=2562239 RepID=A0AA36JCH5_9DINO|nr:unnamed protein product [Effrenium voratum]
MARRRSDLEPSVRLYVVSTGWPYKPSHSPFRPKLLLYGSRATGSGAFEGCLQAAPLCQRLLRPDHDCLFLVDVSEVAGPKDWQEELIRPGRARRMLERWFAKFNCKEATVLAYGEDAELWAPLLALHGELRVARLVLADGEASGSAKAQAEKAKVEVQSVDSKSIVEAVTSQSESNLEIEDLYFTAVDFDIDRKTKQLQQVATNITSLVAQAIAAVPKEQAPEAVAATVSVETEGADLSVPPEVVAMLSDQSVGGGQFMSTHCLVPGTSFANLAVKVLSCRAEDQVLRVQLADCHGRVEGISSEELTVGATVSVAGQAISLEGRLFLLVQQVAGHAGLREGYAPAAPSAGMVRRYGCLVLRGKKCVLARDSASKLFIPTEEAQYQELPQQAAVRALAEACDIYPEEFVLLRDVAPAVFYETSPGPPVVTTIFPALATNPPPPGTSEEEEVLDEEDAYDWFRYDSAHRLLALNERRAVTRLAMDVEAAVGANVVTPSFPCTFGPEPDMPDMPEVSQGYARRPFKRGKKWAACKDGCC